MNLPTHDDIARRAYQLWHEYGSPAGRDTDTWLNAERQLTAKAAAADPVSAGIPAPATGLPASHAAPALPDGEALNAGRQRLAARAPQAPHHTGPHAKPAETGKPLYNRPHSS